MKDLLEKDCIIIANEWELLSLCSKYKIPCKPIHTSFFNRDPTKYAFVISKSGVRECDEKVPVDKNNEIVVKKKVVTIFNPQNYVKTDVCDEHRKVK